MTTQHADGSLLQGKWIKLDDGTFGAQLRVGGKGAEIVGGMVALRSKAGDYTTVTLTALVKDYGAGDVALFTVSR